MSGQKEPTSVNSFPSYEKCCYQVLEKLGNGHLLSPSRFPVNSLPAPPIYPFCEFIFPWLVLHWWQRRWLLQMGNAEPRKNALLGWALDWLCRDFTLFTWITVPPFLPCFHVPGSGLVNTYQSLLLLFRISSARQALHLLTSRGKRLSLSKCRGVFSPLWFYCGYYRFAVESVLQWPAEAPVG